MSQYTERKINEEKFVSNVTVDHITFDTANQRYIATGDIASNSIGTITCLNSKCSVFAKNIKFECLNGLCIQPHTNNILVCNVDSSHVTVFNEQEQLLFNVNPREITHEYTHPGNVECDADGSFAVIEYSGKKIKLFTPDGKYVRTSKKNFGYLSSICYLNRQFSPSASAAAVLVGNFSQKQLCVMSNDITQLVSIVELKDYPTDICVDLNGYVCVVASDLHTCNKLCILEPRMNYAQLQIIKYSPFVNRETGICVNDCNEIALGNMSLRELRFLN